MEPDRWLGVELRHFAALQTVAREGNFGRAARRLGYTQSAVSQQIAALERAVGERLVERPGGPRAVSLTEAGELLLRHAEAIMARLRAAQADLATLADGASGTLRIGTYQSVGARILPGILRRFSANWPQIEISLTESASDPQLLELVERGELDLTFMMLPLPDGPFAAIELLTDPYVLLVQAGSLLAQRRTSPKLSEIAELPLIGPRQCRSFAPIEAHLRAKGHTPRVVFHSDDNGTIQGLVGAGVGAALIPLLAAEPGDENTTIVHLNPQLARRIIAIAWHRDRYRSPAARAFVETAESFCAELQQTLGGPAPALVPAATG
ncbi:MAG: LysR family transcriptional regulator [Gaiella sp.]